MILAGQYAVNGLFFYGSLIERSKGRTIRKVMGGGGEGDFQLALIFFFRPLLVQEFFLQVKPSARIFFSDKDCFVCHFLILKELFCKRIVVLCWF